MTVRQSLVFAKQKLEKKFTSPWLEALDLFAFSLKQSREQILSLEPEGKISQSTAKKVRQLVKERAKGFPLPYILGKQGFCGLEFFVTPAVMIPRPETEALVEEALRRLESCGRGSSPSLAEGDEPLPTVIDVGTGSGCIAIAIAKSFQLSTFNFQLFATDVSAEALEVAKKNAQFHNVADRITFLQGDLLKPLLHSNSLEGQTFILANLPYLTSSDIGANPSLSYEPRLALDGGRDGLSLYRRLFEQIISYPRNPLKSAQSACIFLEIDPRQEETIQKIIHEHLKEAKIQFIPDFSGRPRVLFVEI